MSGVSIQMRGHCFDSIKDMAEVLKNRMNTELICESYRSIGLVNVGTLAFEKFFWRNGSYAALTVVLSENGEEKMADIIGSGGGDGIFNISWGANREMAEDAASILKKFGLEESKDV